MIAPNTSTGGSGSPSMNTLAVCQSSSVLMSYELISSANDLIRSRRKSKCTFARPILAQHPLKSGWWVMTDGMEVLRSAFLLALLSPTRFGGFLGYLFAAFGG